MFAGCSFCLFCSSLILWIVFGRNKQTIDIFCLWIYTINIVLWILMTKGKTQSAGRVMKIINNITDKLSDELKEKLEPGMLFCLCLWRVKNSAGRDRRPAVYFYIPDLFGRAAGKGAAGILYSPPEPWKNAVWKRIWNTAPQWVHTKSHLPWVRGVGTEKSVI